MKEITVDGVKYYSVKPKEEGTTIKIVILQRGWVMVGRFKRKGSDCTLSDASVIRQWGTSRGLGELAEKGPLSTTKLDKCYGQVNFDYLTVVATVDCKEDVWETKL